jgi:hypothetical protein
MELKALKADMGLLAGVWSSEALKGVPDGAEDSGCAADEGARLLMPDWGRLAGDCSREEWKAVGPVCCVLGFAAEDGKSWMASERLAGDFMASL